ncbi:TNFAIP3-interacting protein 1 isoform X2 [Engystomops pustulosus]|uniref:TNFAIP3-interacting protein 1 isoform X2 n=1 Tax=Engystomops pustulosus TaxID=76066 RepID=UPI003AFA85F1
MEGRSPYRIYDPGGSAPKFIDEQQARMAGIPSLGELLEESQNVAHNLRQKAEALIKDTRDLQSSTTNPHAPFTAKMNTVQEKPEEFLHVELSDVKDTGSDVCLTVSPKNPASGSFAEFDILDPSDKRKSPESRQSNPGSSGQSDDDNLHHHLQRMENSLSMFAEESDRNRLLNHMSRLVLEFNRLANKVHKNEQRTSVLQTLCEQLRKENEDLRSKLEVDWNQRNLTEQDLRYENRELKKLLLDRSKVSAAASSSSPATGETTTKVENATHQQTAKLLEKSSNKDQVGSLLKKVKILEHQRAELLDVNKQWDQQFRSMKHQYEEKITSLRQKLSHATKSETEQEAERDRKQRDFDRKLLLARDKIEEKESQIQKLETDLRDLKQKNKILHDQLSSTSRQREYQEREISRLNKALKEALKLQGSAPRSPSFTTEETGLPQRQELITQIDLLKQQVAIFEEDFKRERSDRERMNEEKEDLKREMEQLQTQMAQANTKLQSCQEELRREKENARDLSRPQAVGERYIINHHMGPACPPYQYPYSPPAMMYPGYEDWPICYPPPVVGPEHSQVQDLPNAAPPAYQWRVANAPPRPHNPKGTEVPKSRKKEADGTKKGAQNPQRPT